MKTFKKTILAFAMTTVMGTSAFAASGFEFILNALGGFNFGIPNKQAKDLGYVGEIGGGAGVAAQLGYMFQVKEGFGISLLGELGYSWDVYDMTQMLDLDVDNWHISSINVGSYYHSIQVGLLPKFNIGFGGRHGLAIGIGGGVKIPVSGYYGEGYNMSSVSVNGSSSSTRPTGYEGYDITLKRADIQDIFKPSVIGYVKASIDYYLFFTDKIAMEFGLYFGYDIGMKVADIGQGAFDLGFQLGFRFGPKA